MCPPSPLLYGYLLKREGLGLFFRGAHLPHTHHRACSARDHELGAGADGTENLAPLGQTFVDSHCLSNKVDVRRGPPSAEEELCCAPREGHPSTCCLTLGWVQLQWTGFS